MRLSPCRGWNVALALCALLASTAWPSTFEELRGVGRPRAAPRAMRAPAEVRLEAPKRLRGGRRRAPHLVIALHGGTRTGRSSAERARALFNELHDEARRVKLRLVVPELPEHDASPGASSGEPDTLARWISASFEAQLREMVADFLTDGGDPARVSLAGHGAGGTAALLLAARHPELFSGVALWSASPSPLWDAERRVVGLVEDPVPKLAGLGLFVYTARDDRWLDRNALLQLEREWEAQLRRTGGRGLVRASGGGGHGLGRTGALEGLKALASWRGKLKARGASRGRN